MITKIETTIKCEHKIRSSKLNDIKIFMIHDLSLSHNIRPSIFEPQPVCSGPRKNSWAMEALFLRSNISNRRTVTTKNSLVELQKRIYIFAKWRVNALPCYAFRAIQIPTNTIRLSKTTRKLYEASFRKTNSPKYFLISQIFRWIF